MVEPSGEKYVTCAAPEVQSGHAQQQSYQSASITESSRQDLLESHAPTPVRKFTERDWKIHRAEIVDVYLKDTASRVKQHLEENYGLQASAKQYKDRLKKWGVSKNVRREEWAAIVRKSRDRADAGKASSFKIRGTPINEAKLSRYMHDNPSVCERPPGSPGRAGRAATPSDIEIYTPETASPHSPRNPSSLLSSGDLVSSVDRWRYSTTPVGTTHHDPTFLTKELRMDGLAYTGLQSRQKAGIRLPDPFAAQSHSPLPRGSVILILWEDDTSSSLSLLQQLAAVFQHKFMLDTEIWMIPIEKSQFRVHMKVLEFADQSEKYPLLAVCYAGDGRLTEQYRLEWTSPVKAEDGTIQTVKWSGIQSTLEEAKSDVLLIFGCCASLASSPDCHGAVEYLAASAYGTPGSSEVFFMSLLQALTELAISTNPLGVAALYTRLLLCMHRLRQVGGLPKTSTPVHIRLNNESTHDTRTIILSPVPASLAFEALMPPTDSAYQSKVSSTIDLLRPRKRSRRVEKDVNGAKPFQCTRIKADGTYCLQENIHVADWKRHEETHWPQKRWECLIHGSNGNVACHFCGGHIDLVGQSTVTHGQCLGRVLRMNHDFRRKDKLIKHIKEVHGCVANVDTWYTDINSDWKRQCGFCGETFTDWDTRCVHVSGHFATGLRMRPHWKDPWPENHENHDRPPDDDDTDDDDDDNNDTG